MMFLQELLKLVGLADRLSLEWISSAEAQRFVQVATTFTEKIRRLGPSPISIHKEQIEALSPRAMAGFPVQIRAEVLDRLFAEERQAIGA
jgi:hypothetical protein